MKARYRDTSNARALLISPPLMTFRLYPVYVHIYRYIYDNELQRIISDFRFATVLMRSIAREYMSLHYSSRLLWLTRRLPNR